MIAFEKYDGTNLHFTWSRQHGWDAFGTRRDQFPFTSAGFADFASRHRHLREAPILFAETWKLGLDKVLLDLAREEVQEVRVFLELFGPNSFAGLHCETDVKELKLFDVWTDNTGFLGPDRFVARFGHLNVARVVYRGKFTGTFAEDVRSGKYGVNEGVVCKGGSGGDRLWMVKIKTDEYQRRLQLAFREQWTQYWE